MLCHIISLQRSIKATTTYSVQHMNESSDGLRFSFELIEFSNKFRQQDESVTTFQLHIKLLKFIVIDGSDRSRTTLMSSRDFPQLQRQ